MSPQERGPATPNITADLEMLRNSSHCLQNRPSRRVTQPLILAHLLELPSMRSAKRQQVSRNSSHRFVCDLLRSEVTVQTMTGVSEDDSCGLNQFDVMEASAAARSSGHFITSRQTGVGLGIRRFGSFTSRVEEDCALQISMTFMRSDR